MKNTQLTCAVLLSLFIFASCNEGTDDDILDTLKGTIVFTSQVAQMEPIVLRNAKTQQLIKEDGRPWVTIHEASIEDQTVGDVIYEGWLDENNSIKLKPGDYLAGLKLITQTGEMAGEVEAESKDVDFFTVVSGQVTQHTIKLYPNYIAVAVNPLYLDGATIWVGPEGFEPSDEYLQPETGAVYLFIKGNFDVVVEYEGQTKRFTAPANPGMFHLVIIQSEPDQGVEPGTATFGWELEWFTNDKKPIIFEW